MPEKTIEQLNDIPMCLCDTGTLPSGREWIWYAESGIELLNRNSEDPTKYKTESIDLNDPEYPICEQIEAKYEDMFINLKQQFCDTAIEIASRYGWRGSVEREDIADFLVDNNGNPITYDSDYPDDELFDEFDRAFDISESILQETADTLNIPRDYDQRDFLTDYFWDDIKEDVIHDVADTIRSVEPAVGWPIPDGPSYDY